MLTFLDGITDAKHVYRHMYYCTVVIANSARRKKTLGITKVKLGSMLSSFSLSLSSFFFLLRLTSHPSTLLSLSLPLSVLSSNPLNAIIIRGGKKKRGGEREKPNPVSSALLLERERETNGSDPPPTFPLRQLRGETDPKFK